MSNLVISAGADYHLYGVQVRYEPKVPPPHTHIALHQKVPETLQLRMPKKEGRRQRGKSPVEGLEQMAEDSAEGKQAERRIQNSSRRMNKQRKQEKPGLCPTGKVITRFNLLVRGGGSSFIAV